MRKVIAILILACLFCAWSVVPALAVDVGWQPVVGPEAATPAGFIGMNNAWAPCAVAYNGYLYVSTSNMADGAQIWRTQDGLTWQPVIGPGGIIGSGFAEGTNSSTIFAMCVYNDYLYATLYNNTGARVWRSNDPTTGWTLIVGPAQGGTRDPGFGDPDNRGIYSMNVFENRLYAGLLNYGGGGGGSGGKIWRSGTNDPFNWSQALDLGASHIDNESVKSLSPFGDTLYAGTRNRINGFSVLSSDDGAAWTERVGYAPAPVAGGFGDVNNWEATALCEFRGALYAATLGNGSMTEIRRTTDGTTWEQITQGFGGTTGLNATYSLVSDGTYLYAGTGLSSRVYATSDGASWYQINTDRFGDGANSEVRSMAFLNGYLYAATNAAGGLQVWRVNDESVRAFFAGQTAATTLPYTGEAEAESEASAEGEGSHEANPVKDFAIVFGIALAAVAVGFVAFKSGRKKVKE